MCALDLIQYGGYSAAGSWGGQDVDIKMPTYMLVAILVFIDLLDHPGNAVFAILE